MKNMQHLLIVPLLVLTGLALSACGGSVPFNFPAEAGIEEIIDGFEADELEFSGIVQVIGAEAWTISDLEIRIVEETGIDDEIVVGDFVEVEALQFGDGTLIAEEIELSEGEVDDTDDEIDVDELDDDYDFTGILQVITDDAWIIDDQVFVITTDTEIDDDITVGDAVEVEAQVDEDGSLSALEIELADDDLDADSDVDGDDDIDDIDDNDDDVDDDVEDVDGDDNNEDDVEEDDVDEDDDEDDDDDDDNDTDDGDDDDTD